MTGARGRRLLAALWGLLALGVAASAIPHIDDLGLYYDEAFMAQQARDFVEPERAGTHPGSVRSIDLFGRPFPLRNAAYLGSLKSQLLIPSFAIFGASPLTLRATTLATGLLALLLSMLWAERIFGAASAAWMGAFVATDPGFYFLAQFEWGPFTTNFLCRAAGLLLAGIAWRLARDPKRSRGAAHAAAIASGACFGLGVFSRADFAVILAAGGIALAVCHASLIRDAFRDHRALLSSAGAALVVCASPMLASAVALVSSSSQISDRGGLDYKAQVLWSVLDGSHFLRLLEVGGRFEAMFDAAAPAGPFGFVLIGAALHLVHRALRRRGRAAPKEEAAPDPRPFLLLACVLLTAAMLAMPGAVRAHHQLNSMPFLQLVVGIALVDLWRAGGEAGPRGRLGRRILAITAGTAILVGNLLVIADTHSLIAATGGRGRFSHALDDLAARIDTSAGNSVVSLDWGFHEPLLFSTDRARLFEPIWAMPHILRQGRPWIFAGDANTTYLAHDEKYDLFGLGPDFLAMARAAAPRGVSLEPHRDGSGEPAFYSVRIPWSHRLSYGRGFRID